MGEPEGLAAAAVRYAPPRARRAGEGGGSCYDHVRRSIYLRSPRNVTFSCPTCNVHITAPVGGRFEIRCDVCRTALGCVT